MFAATMVGVSGFASQAQDPDLELTRPLAQWERAFTLRTGAGYKDNVALAHAAAKASPFLATGADAFLSRVSLAGSLLDILLTYEDSRFLSGGAVDQEQLAFGQAQARKLLADDAVASLNARYLFLNQVLDISITETNRESVLVQGHTFTLEPGLRKDLPRGWWAQADLPVTRQFLLAPLDDYWEFGPKFSCGRAYARDAEVSLDYQMTFRPFDHEQDLTVAGGRVPGTRRSFTQQEVRLIWKHGWDAARRWQTTARFSFKVNNDSGVGYSDFDRFSGSGEVRYHAERWEFKAEARLSHYFYPVQTVSLTDTRHRERTELVVNLRCERQLTKSLRLVAVYERERVTANDPLDTYTVNTVSGGVQWEF